jgi:hypothetical protein
METVLFCESLISYLVDPLTEINVMNVQLSHYREPYEIKLVGILNLHTCIIHIYIFFFTSFIS